MSFQVPRVRVQLAMSSSRKRTALGSPRVDPKQLTLFSCRGYQAKKIKVVDDVSQGTASTSGPSTMNEDIEEVEDCDPELTQQSASDSESDFDDSDCHRDTAGSSLAVSRDESVYQDNYISVDKPSGSMTIIFNSRRSSSLDTPLTKPSQSSFSDHATTVPSDISQGVGQAPVQPRIKYPCTTIDAKKRSFNSDWFAKYHWLEYSKERDAVFCYACRMFSTSIGKKSDVFTNAGLRDWKHATGQNGILAKDDSSYTHKQAMLSWAEYMNGADKNMLIEDRLDSTRKQEIQDNRHYLKSIVEVILLCARQEQAP